MDSVNRNGIVSTFWHKSESGDTSFLIQYFCCLVIEKLNVFKSQIPTDLAFCSSPFIRILYV